MGQSDAEFGETLLQAPISGAGAGNTVLVADPGDKKRIIVTAIILNCGAAASAVKFFITGGADLTGAMAFAANGGTAIIGDRDSPVLIVPASEGLSLNSGAAGPINGWILYYIETVFS